MGKIPPQLLQEILADPFYKVCARKGKDCSKKITFEHTLIYGSKQIQEKFAIIPLCTFHHAVNEYQDGGDLNKNINKWIALSRATSEELDRYSKVINYKRELGALTKVYGKWKN